MQIKGPIKIVRQEDKIPSEILIEMLKEEGKKVKLEVPFLADGFKSEKNPTQPDGITPITIMPISTEPKVDIKPKEPVIEKRKYNKEELIKMNKSEQTKILESYGVKKVPLVEKDRVKKILELQEVK